VATSGRQIVHGQVLGRVGLQPFTAFWEVTHAVPENVVVDRWGKAFLFTLDHFLKFFLYGL